jgi:hypothetical protein
LVPFAITDYALARQIGQWDAVEREALRSGNITADEVQRWRTYLDDADRDGVFFASASVCVGVGRVP